tara:strand:- start:2131 stop:2499 length:369 start_codon:yes stop_codon:yes gene_type:complete
MPKTVKRKSQRAGGGCTWRNGSSRKNSVRKLKMRGGAHHNHPKGRGRSMRGGGGCGYKPSRGRSMRGGGHCGNHPKVRSRSMRGGGYGGSSSGSSWGKIPKRRNMRKRKGVVIENEPSRKRR